MHSELNERTLMLTAAASFVDGYNLIIITPVVLLAGSAFTINQFYSSFLVSAALIGNFAGALLLGNLSDRLGRKFMLLWDILFFVVFGLLSALAFDVIELILLRLLLGIGIGGDYPIGSTLLSENSNPALRGRRVGLLGFSWTLGFLAAILTGLLLIHAGGVAWRLMLLAPVFPSAGIIVARNRIRESNVWQSHVRGREDAGNIAQIFGTGMIRLTIFAAAFWFIFDVLQYGITLYSPSVVRAVGFTTVNSSLGGSLLIAAVELIATLFGIAVVDRSGRRALLLAGFAGIALSMFLASFISEAMISLLLLLGLAFSAGFGPGILEFIFPPELFPANIRATGAGFANSMSRLGAVVGVAIEPAIVGMGGIHSLFLIYGSLALIGFLITYLLAPETRGKTLMHRSATNPL